MYVAPAYITIVLIIGEISMIGLTSLALYRGGRVAGMPDRAAYSVAGSVALALTGWAVLSALLSRDGAYVQRPGITVPLLGVVLLGTLAAALLVSNTRPVATSLADSATPSRLAVVQTFRVLGVLFLLVMVQGQLPAAFALPAGLGDIAIGIAAPFVARKLAAGKGRTDAIWFNVLGLIDLIVAVGIGFLAAPGPYQLLHIDPSTSPLPLFPFALIPTVAVPIAAAMHIVSLRALRGATLPVEGMSYARG